MIFKDKSGKFAIRCSHCGKVGKQVFDTWQQAIDSKKAAGVMSFTDKADKWHELCPICAKNENIVKSMKESGADTGW